MAGRSAPMLERAPRVDAAMIIVTGSVVARSETFEEIMAISSEHVRRSRTEPGCISHAVFRDIENPLRLQFVDRWTDMAALNTHFAVPASRAMVTAIAALAAERPGMTLYDASEMQTR